MGSARVPEGQGKDPERLVIVVSDDRHLRDELEYGFPSGVAVRMATDAREALRAMEKETPSAVVVDLQTGSAGGFALSRDMDDIARFRDVPVVILIERTQDEWLAKQAGADAVLLKPIEMSRLVDDVMALIAAAV
jgi:DNA-binding response OmpR family regulator